MSEQADDQPGDDLRRGILGVLVGLGIVAIGFLVSAAVSEEVAVILFIGGGLYALAGLVRLVVAGSSRLG